MDDERIAFAGFDAGDGDGLWRENARFAFSDNDADVERISIGIGGSAASISTNDIDLDVEGTSFSRRANDGVAIEG